MTTIYYPQSALEGFAKGLNSLLGVDVKFKTGKPRTDGDTVYLPPITGYLDESGFEAMCGIALHEAAHVSIGSLKTFHRYAAQSQLHAECMNTVLDVADESRMEFVMSRARELFRASNKSAFYKNAKAGAYQNGDARWIIECFAILLNRVSQPEWADVLAEAKQSSFWPLINKAYQIVRKARTRRMMKVVLRRGSFATIIKLSNQLVELFKAAGMADDRNSNESGPMVAGSDGVPTGRELTPAEMNGATIAGDAEGFDQALRLEASRRSNQGGNSNGQPSEPEQPEFDSGLHAAVSTCIGGAIGRMVWSKDADAADDGFTSGKGLSRNIERALIDGRCFTRKESGDGERLHAVILLDQSGSMRSSMGMVSAVAQAFVDSLRRVADTVTLGTFNTSTRPADDFRKVDSYGGTDTTRAIEWADRQLADRRGRKVLICVTDGGAGDPTSCGQACTTVKAHGINLIGIAYQLPAEYLTPSMPGAQVIAANDPGQLACQLSRVAQAIGA